jgi:hypothetical protein
LPVRKAGLAPFAVFAGNAWVTKIIIRIYRVLLCFIVYYPPASRPFLAFFAPFASFARNNPIPSRPNIGCMLGGSALASC